MKADCLFKYKINEVVEVESEKPWVCKFRVIGRIIIQTAGAHMVKYQIRSFDQVSLGDVIEIFEMELKKVPKEKKPKKTKVKRRTKK